MATEEQLVAGLVQRGMPLHIAQGFVTNFKDESGLNPGINEIAPIVPGSRGGYGLYQLTGPRRRQYESWAADQGMDLADPNAQLDFLMLELNTTEKRAWDRIQRAGTAGEAAAAIVNDFLRPAESHRASRESRYLGGKTTAATGEGYVAADPTMAAGPAGMPAAPTGQQNALAPQQPVEPPRPQIAMMDPRAFMVAQPNALAFQPFETQRVNYLSGRG
jgi:hypothetical protein